MTPTWAGLLAAYARSLDELERWLEHGQGAPPAGWRAPETAPEAAPTPLETARMAELLDRSTALTVRLEREMAHVRDETRGERRRWDGQRAYLSAQRVR